MGKSLHRRDRRAAATDRVKRAKLDYTRQMQPGDPDWDNMLEMERWMWVGASVYKTAEEG